MFDTGGCRDRAMLAGAALTAGPAVVPLVERLWPQIGRLAGKICSAATVRHVDVLAALQLSADGPTSALQLAHIRAGAVPGSFRVTRASSDYMNRPWQAYGMRTYFSRWRQPTRRDLAGALLICLVVVLGVAWGIQESQTQSQEAKKAKYESCLNEAAATHISGLPSLDEIQACKEAAGVK